MAFSDLFWSGLKGTPKRNHPVCWGSILTRPVGLFLGRIESSFASVGRPEALRFRPAQDNLRPRGCLDEWRGTRATLNARAHRRFYWWSPLSALVVRETKGNRRFLYFDTGPHVFVIILYVWATKATSQSGLRLVVRKLATCLRVMWVFRKTSHPFWAATFPRVVQSHPPLKGPPKCLI